MALLAMLTGQPSIMRGDRQLRHESRASSAWAASAATASGFANVGDVSLGAGNLGNLNLGGGARQAN